MPWWSCTRVRRARDKYVKLYRREASAKVVEYGGRGKAGPRSTRNRGKAEVFEDALARVSRALAAAARRSARELRTERIAASQAERNMAPPRATRPGGNRRAEPTSPRGPKTDRRPDSPALRKRHADTRATGARRQTRKDTRTG